MRKLWTWLRQIEFYKHDPEITQLRHDIQFYSSFLNNIFIPACAESMRYMEQYKLTEAEHFALLYAKCRHALWYYDLAKPSSDSPVNKLENTDYDLVRQNH